MARYEILMLKELSIRNVILIDKLDLSFNDGLCVLTGETGAGKSILLDSLGLALGERGGASLIRSGEEKLSVSASFELPKGHPVWAVLDEYEIEKDADDESRLNLRRVINADGKGKAFVNEQAINSTILRKIGDELVEVHGQFETHGLMNPVNHRSILDAYGKLGGLSSDCNKSYNKWHEIKKQRIAEEEMLSRSAVEEDYIRHVIDELEAFAPKEGEEKALSEERALLMNSEKLIDAVSGAYGAINSARVANVLVQAQGSLIKAVSMAEAQLNPIIESLERASIELSEATSMLEVCNSEFDLDPKKLEHTEERLFALRALARKHNVLGDDLLGVLKAYKARLDAIDNGTNNIAKLLKDEEQARLSYIENAQRLSDARKKSADALDKAVAKELPPLKLDKATFKTMVELVSENEWNSNGWDKVSFTVSTNVGAPQGPINKIASGGELARFMLALKVNLAQSATIPSLVFDEVDTGIGGATASAVGERLAKLGQNLQVLVITHSPQVASRGKQHLKVEKLSDAITTRTQVKELSKAERHEEIARMLSGETITDAARAAADDLLKASA